MRRNRIIVLLAMTITVFGINASAQTTDQKTRIDITLKPGTTAEERASDKLKERQLLEDAEEKRKADLAAAIQAKDPKAALAHVRIISVTSMTTYFKPVMLQNALHKRSDFDKLQLAMIDSTKIGVADAVIQIDRPLFTYYFIYTITDSATGLILSTGRVTAFDGSVAAGKLAEKIVQDIAKARKS